jgi:FtsP/CotA-like multicopper oxidase with cupredoxin domain
MEMDDLRRISRRTFVAWVGGASAGFYLFGRLPGADAPEALAAIPGGTLDPTAVPRFVTPLVVPPVMPRAGTIVQRGGKNVDYYEISMRQISQQILPAGLPATTVWAYGAKAARTNRGLLVHHAPSLTIEAQWNRPVRVKWVNELVDENGGYLPHLLPVDPTLHWANPPGGTTGRDARPTYDETPGPYSGPVPIVTHVHGAVGVGDESDGYAEAWYLPAAEDIPDGYAVEGTWYPFFRDKARAAHGVEWGPGYAVFQYPNAQRAATLWYHDHALGMTRLNVYAGPAGFFVVRGGPAGDGAVLDSRTGAVAVLPGPAPRENDKFPPNKRYREIPIAIQDRAFNDDGSLFYPETRAFFDGIEGPYLPETDVSPIWNPEFFGNTIMVNGNTWPFLEVERRRYRFRFLNGCQSRFLILDLSGIPGVEAWQIGNEGGFLAAPYEITGPGEGRLLMAPAERADVIVDFANVPVGSHVLRNVGPDEPFGGGSPAFPPDEPGEGEFPVADPATTGQVLQFRVVPAVEADDTTPPRFLVLPPVAPLPSAVRTRPLALLEEMSADFEDAPAAAVLGTVEEGTAVHRMWADPVTENPAVGDVETWEFHNFTADAHPMHVHEGVFQVVDRQPITFDEHMGHVHEVELAGPARPPEPWESGWKDTVVAYPGEVTRIRMHFPVPGQFVWHCHIVEHEDNEMMRPYRIGPEQPGQPMPGEHAG